MNKIVFSFLVLFMASNVALAGKIKEPDLSEHGKDLRKASFPVRHNFNKAYLKDWGRSTFSERKAFLIKWHNQLIEEEKKAQVQAKLDAIAQREKEKQKREALKKEEEKIRAEEREAQGYQKDYDKRAKNFNKMVNSQRRSIETLRRRDSK